MISAKLVNKVNMIFSQNATSVFESYYIGYHFLFFYFALERSLINLSVSFVQLQHVYFTIILLYSANGNQTFHTCALSYLCMI